MLFQIEEPDGTPLDEPDGPGAAIGVDLAGARGAVAIAVGGNAEILTARDGAPGPETTVLRDALGRIVLAVAAAVPLWRWWDQHRRRGGVGGAGGHPP